MNVPMAGEGCGCAPGAQPCGAPPRRGVKDGGRRMGRQAL
eukprot:CAMPEP_0198500474 /NCGR_PEP_ID=MMETSP1462-20131121/8182_1 /TAXON_ID=1333877 /ORGANISM="Brandtodinium nutriculum, Strain RCC3387" /LENGTH=39 /DNA_ID= /DNA_START= /DNA_END= /DNA_ORIENTATION=